MAQSQGLPHQDVAVAEVAKVVQVRAAEAGRLDGHLDIVGAERGKDSFFLGRNVSLGPGSSGRIGSTAYHSQIPSAMQDRGVHPRGSH